MGHGYAGPWFEGGRGNRPPSRSSDIEEPHRSLAGVTGVSSDDEGDVALRELYAACYSRLVRVVGAVAGDRDEAEEAVQEAFIRLIGRWGSVSRYDDPEAWLRKVAFGFLSNRRRKIGNGARALIRHGGGADSAPPPSGDRVDLERALQALPIAQRQVLVLVHVVGLGVDAAADELGIPVGTVKSRLARGRAVLAPLLREGVPDHA